MQQKQLTKHKPPELCLCCNKEVETSERKKKHVGEFSPQQNPPKTELPFQRWCFFVRKWEENIEKHEVEKLWLQTLLTWATSVYV